jgi:hypothetical protein
VNTYGVGTALAARFGSITPPTGYEAIKLATVFTPDNISTYPAVIVLPPDTSLSYSMNRQVDEIHVFTVRFIIPRSMGTDRGIKALYAWRDAIVKGAVGNQDLDVVGVVSCLVTNVTMGDVSYGADDDLFAIDCRTEVRFRSVVTEIGA